MSEAEVSVSIDRMSLQRLRDGLLAKRADIDRAVDALNVLLADDVLMSPRIVVEAAPPAIPEEPPAKRIAPAPDEWADRRARAQTMYMQGTGPQEIADTLRLSIRRVDKWIQRGKWRDQRRGILQERTPEPVPECLTHPEYDPEAETKAKAMFLAGKPVRSIAAVLNRSMQTIYGWSSRGKWSRERQAAKASPSPATLADPTVERIRAQRRAADDAIIEQVRQEMEDARNPDKVNSFGEHAPRVNGRSP